MTDVTTQQESPHLARSLVLAHLAHAIYTKMHLRVSQLALAAKGSRHGAPGRLPYGV